VWNLELIYNFNTFCTVPEELEGNKHFKKSTDLHPKYIGKFTSFEQINRGSTTPPFVTQNRVEIS
jgi:hypothetical protein